MGQAGEEGQAKCTCRPHPTGALWLTSAGVKDLLGRKDAWKLPGICHKASCGLRTILGQRHQRLGGWLGGLCARSGGETQNGVQRRQPQLGGPGSTDSLISWLCLAPGLYFSQRRKRRKRRARRGKGEGGSCGHFEKNRSALGVLLGSQPEGGKDKNSSKLGEIHYTQAR